jgi:hypothetical protein
MTKQMCPSPLTSSKSKDYKYKLFPNPIGNIPREFFPCNICDINFDCSSFEPKPNQSFSFDTKN